MAKICRTFPVVIKEALGPAKKGDPGVCTPGEKGMTGRRGMRGAPGDNAGFAPFLLVPGVENIRIKLPSSSQTITLGSIIGGMPPYTRTFSRLPSSIVYDGDRTLTVTPTVNSNGSATYTVTDSASPPATSSQTFTYDFA